MSEETKILNCVMAAGKSRKIFEDIETIAKVCFVKF